MKLGTNGAIPSVFGQKPHWACRTKLLYYRALGGGVWVLSGAAAVLCDSQAVFEHWGEEA